MRLQHLDDLLVRAAVERSPQRADAGRHARVEIRLRAAHHAHRAGGAVLLVVGVQDQQQVERLGEDRIDLELVARRREHHVQEVRRVVQLVHRVHERLADGVLVGIGRERRHLGDEPDDRVVRVARVAVAALVERGEAGDGGRADRHRMRVLGHGVEEAAEVLVEQRVPRDLGRGSPSTRPASADCRRAAARPLRGTCSSRRDRRCRTRGTAGCPSRRR